MSTKQQQLSMLDHAASMQSLKESIRDGIAKGSPETVHAALAALLPLLGAIEAESLSRAAHQWEFALGALSPPAPSSPSTDTEEAGP